MIRGHAVALERNFSGSAPGAPRNSTQNDGQAAMGNADASSSSFIAKTRSAELFLATMQSVFADFSRYAVTDSMQIIAWQKNEPTTAYLDALDLARLRGVCRQTYGLFARPRTSDINEASSRLVSYCRMPLNSQVDMKNFRSRLSNIQPFWYDTHGSSTMQLACLTSMQNPGPTRGFVEYTQEQKTAALCWLYIAITGVPEARALQFVENSRSHSIYVEHLKQDISHCSRRLSDALVVATLFCIFGAVGDVVAYCLSAGQDHRRFYGLSGYFALLGLFMGTPEYLLGGFALCRNLTLLRRIERTQNGHNAYLLHRLRSHYDYDCIGCADTEDCRLWATFP